MWLQSIKKLVSIINTQKFWTTIRDFIFFKIYFPFYLYKKSIKFTLEVKFKWFFNEAMDHWFRSLSEKYLKQIKQNELLVTK